MPASSAAAWRDQSGARSSDRGRGSPWRKAAEATAPERRRRRSAELCFEGDRVGATIIACDQPGVRRVGSGSQILCCLAAALKAATPASASSAIMP